MKHIVVGDTHGRITWQKIAAKETFDKMVFIGDYFDSFNIPGDEQIRNFLEIIKFKKANPDKVVLLIGNHDYHYLDMGETYSGFQRGYQYEIRNLIKENLDLMQMSYIYDKFLFTHAGVTKTWLSTTGYTGEEPLDIFINDLFKYKPLSFAFTSGPSHNNYGDEICQTPIWVRPRSLRDDHLEDYIHVVGHTQHREITILNFAIFTDALDEVDEYLVIEGNSVEVKNLEE